MFVSRGLLFITTTNELIILTTYQRTIYSTKCQLLPLSLRLTRRVHLVYVCESQDYLLTNSTVEQHGLKKIASGKVREIYEIDPQSLLFVATDRISAYDVIMKNGVPQKGALLTLMTTHWFNLFKEKIPDLKTHLISAEVPESVAKTLPAEVAEQLRLRTMHVRRLKVLPLESIVRGYITGSAWSEYKKSGTVHGIAMPKGLQESQKLETPLWTPSTKAEVGDKDENISPEEATKIVGEKYAKKIEELSLKVYQIVSVDWEWLVMGFWELISVYYRL